MVCAASCPAADYVNVTDCIEKLNSSGKKKVEKTWTRGKAQRIMKQDLRCFCV